MRPVLTFVACLLLCSLASAAPNIVLILADDQGWNALSERMDPDVSGSQSDYYQTPNLARLASEGMRFTRGYAPAPVCSPTRHSIQFGMSPAKTRVTHNAANKRQHCEPQLALASLIKQANGDYATAHFGKWHVSLKPDACGYDVSDGPTANGEGSNSKNVADPKRVFEVTERSIAFMEKQTKAGKPFFLQVSHYADHLAFRARPESVAKYEALPKGEIHDEPVFAAMNEDLDSGVGLILDAIERLGIAGETYVFYTADNGYDESNSRYIETPKRKAWPLSYSKGFVREGGIRVPFIVRGPDVKAGSVCRAPVVGYDLAPTILDLIDPAFAVPDRMEGGSLLPMMRNKGRGDVKRSSDFLVFHYPTGVWPSQTALIKSDFKIIKSWAYDRIELFNLKDDLSESRDLSQKHPEKAEELHRALMQYLRDVEAVMPPEAELAFDRQGPLMKKKGAGGGKKQPKGKKK